MFILTKVYCESPVNLWYIEQWCEQGRSEGGIGGGGGAAPPNFYKMHYSEKLQVYSENSDVSYLRLF